MFEYKKQVYASKRQAAAIYFSQLKEVIAEIEWVTEHEVSEYLSSSEPIMEAKDEYLEKLYSISLHYMNDVLEIEHSNQ